MAVAFADGEPADGVDGRARLLRRRGRRPWLSDAAGRGQPAHRLPRADREGAHRRADVARVPAHPGHRLHRGGLRRGLLPLPRADGAGSTPRCRPRRSAGAGRRPGSQVNTVFLWSIANFWLLGRKIVASIDPARRRPRAGAHGARLLGAGRRWLPGRRAPARPGTPASATPYDQDIVDALLAGVEPVDDDTPGRDQALQRHPDHLPVPPVLRHPGRHRRHRPVPRCADGRTLLVRDYYRLGQSDFWWSTWPRTCRTSNLTAALVLDDVDFTITDFGTAKHRPRGLPRPPRRLRAVHHRHARRLAAPVGLDELDADHGRGPHGPVGRTTGRIAAMDRDEKIRCGAYVYFSFLKPFADEAGVGDDLDWTVPRRPARPSGTPSSRPWRARTTGVDEEGPYYAPVPWDASMTLPGWVRRSPRRPRADEGRHEPGRRAVLERVVVLRLHRTRRARSAATSGSASTRTCGARWYWACLVGEGRPLVTVIDHEVPLPAGPARSRSAPRACGPTTPSRRRSTT